MPSVDNIKASLNYGCLVNEFLPNKYLGKSSKLIGGTRYSESGD